MSVVRPSEFLNLPEVGRLVKKLTRREESPPEIHAAGSRQRPALDRTGVLRLAPFVGR